MNFEDGEIVLAAANLLYDANVKSVGIEKAEQKRRELLEELVRAWRTENPDIASSLPVEEEARLRSCDTCPFEKPLVLFRREADNSYAATCMDCEAEALWREEKEATKHAELIGKQKVTRAMILEALNDGQELTVEDLKHVIASGRDFSHVDIELSIRSHIRRLVNSGEIVVVGKVEYQRVGRPRAIYATAKESNPSAAGIR